MNEAILTGKLVSYTYSHTIKGVKIYEGVLAVRRPSGTEDAVLFHSWKTDIQVGKTYCITGEVRTARTPNAYPKKKTYIKLKTVGEYTKPEEEQGDKNEITLSGKLVGKTPIRQTPISRKSIIDFQIEVPQGDSVIYPSLIAWGFTAKQVDSMEEGTEVKISGQLHRREYLKGDGVFYIYEISCFSVEALK